jgi:hypothetical protein
MRKPNPYTGEPLKSAKSLLWEKTNLVQKKDQRKRGVRFDQALFCYATKQFGRVLCGWVSGGYFSAKYSISRDIPAQSIQSVGILQYKIFSQ